MIRPGTTRFLRLWTRSLWLQIAPGAPLFFPLVSGLFDLLLLMPAEICNPARRL